MPLVKHDVLAGHLWGAGKPGNEAGGYEVCGSVWKQNSPWYFVLVYLLLSPVFSGSAKHHQPHCRNHLALLFKAISQLQLDWGLQSNLRDVICLGVEVVPMDT